MNFNDYNDTLNNQMSQGQDGKNLDSAASDLSRAAQNLSTNSTAQGQQAQNLAQSVQSTQMQISTLSNNIQSLVNQMRMQQVQTSGGAGAGMVTPMAPPPIPSQQMPPPNAGGGGFQAAMGTAGQTAMGVGGAVASGVGAGMIAGGQGTQNLYHGSLHNNVGVELGFQPGVVNAPNMGLMGSAWHGMNPLFDPHAARSYTAGAYQRGMANQAGTQAGDWVRGAGVGIAGLFSAENAANIGAGMTGPLGAAAGMLGIPGAVARPFDALNPVQFASREIGRATTFEGASGHHSHKFLRGRGGEERGNFDIREGAEIGLGLQKQSLFDLSFDTDEIAQMQQDMASSNQMLGVQTVEQYKQRMSDAISTARTTMKTLQMTNEEAMGFMSGMFNQVGFDHDQMGDMVTRTYAGAHLSGKSPQEMNQIAMAGAAGAGGFGLLNTTGATNAISAQNLAGQSATHTQRTNVLASVGGEEGLQQLLLNATNQFMAGSGGTLMGLGGAYGNVQDGISRASNNLRGQGDVLDFRVNRHNILEGIGALDQQAQGAAELFDLAQKMSPSGDPRDIRNTMIELAVSQGRVSNHIEGEALVDSFQALPASIRRQMETENQAVGDEVRDINRQENNFFNKARLGYRDAYWNATGGATEGFVSGTAGIGERTRNITRGISNYNWGNSMTERFIEEDHITNLSSNDFLTSRGGVASDSAGVSAGRRLHEGRGIRGLEGEGPTAHEEEIQRAIDSGDMGYARDLSSQLMSGDILDENQIRQTSEFRRHQNEGRDTHGHYQRQYRQILSSGRISDEEFVGVTEGLTGRDSEQFNAVQEHLGRETSGGRKIKSEEEIIEELRDRLQIGGFGAFRDEDVLATASDPLFNRFEQALRKVLTTFDHEADDQSDNTKNAMRELRESYVQLQDAEDNESNRKKKRIASSLLRRMRVDVDRSRSGWRGVRVKGNRRTRLGVDGHRRRSFIQANDGGSLTEMTQSSAARTAADTSIRDSLQRDFGSIHTDSFLTDEGIDTREIREAFRGVDRERLEELAQSGDRQLRGLAQYGMDVQDGRLESLSDEERKQMDTAVGMAMASRDITSSIGRRVQTEGLGEIRNQDLISNMQQSARINEGLLLQIDRLNGILEKVESSGGFDR